MATDPFLPRYREIELALRSRIAALKPGDPIASDAELCAEFGVSRMTARTAVQRLADEGLIRREPGRGSFVAEPPAHRRANSLVSFSNEMRRQGRTPGSRLLDRVVREPAADEARDLRLREGETVVALRRIRLADGEPLALETAVLPGRCAPAVMHADLEQGSLHEALLRAGHRLSRGDATLASEAASAEDARLLGIRVRDPLLVERRLIRDEHGRPLERTESRYMGDRYALDVAFEVDSSRPPGGARPRLSR